MASEVDRLLEGRPEALSIAELYDGVEGALYRAFPRGRGVWVRGEIQSLSDRTGHCYFDLVDPESARDRQAPVLKVKCWRRAWGSLRASMARQGVELATGMVVVLRGSVDFYRPRAEVSFILAEVDVTALLGRLAAQRAALLRALAEEGVLDRNHALVVPEVPRRVGLVASPSTEGYRDFMGQLDGSGFGFDVFVAPVKVQGAAAPAAIARAVAMLERRGSELIVVVRGGGSKADLGAFDTEMVARAVVRSTVPIWTGIGHTGDESVADIVANRSFITPTECGRELGIRVSGWWDRSVAAPVERLVRRAQEAMSDTGVKDTMARRRLTSTARQQLSAHESRLRDRVDRVIARAPSAQGAARAHLGARALRVEPLAQAHLARRGDQLASWRRLLAAYDVERQLERGYTLTLDHQGRPVRSVGGLVPGGHLTTRFSDGSATSRLVSVSSGRGPITPAGDDTKGEED